MKLELSVIVLAFTISGCHGDPQCPWGYTFQHDNSCYLISHDKADWIGAVGSCRLMDGYLVEIESNNESLFIQGIARINGASDKYWIGLNNKRDQTQWNWATSQQPARGRYESWAAGEPNNIDGNEGCVLIDDDNNHGYRWADADCHRLEKYICETTKPVTTTPSTTTPSTTTPSTTTPSITKPATTTSSGLNLIG